MDNASTLKRRVIKASFWSIAGYGLNIILRFGSNLIMTRILMPQMFGLMALATTVLIGLTMFSDLGLKQNVVQNVRGHDPSFLNTAWSMQVLRGVLLWGGALFVSGSVAVANHLGWFASDSVYASSELPFILVALSFQLVIQGLESTKLFEASRGLALSSVTRVEILSQLSGLMFMLGWAFFDRSIWVLVIGSLGAATVRTALSHLSLEGVANRWHWDRSAASDLFHFGKWIFVTSILGFMVNSGDKLLLGGLVDASTLGLYAIASLLASTIGDVLSRIMSDVSFPAFSEVARDRRESLKKHYYHFHFVMSAIAYTAAGFLVSFGHELIVLMYDKRYEQAGWMLQVLSLTLLTIPFRLSTQMFMALGKPNLLSYVILVRLIVLLVGTPIAFNYFGLPGAVVLIVVSQFASLPIIIFYNVKLDFFKPLTELGLLLFLPAGLCLGMLATSVLSFLKILLFSH